MLLGLLNDKGQCRLLDVGEILYMQTDGTGDLTIYSYDEKFRTISSAEDFAEFLREAGFVRTDRGTLVNMRQVEAYDPAQNVLRLRLKEGEVLVPAARNRRRILRDYFAGKQV
ncbi:LytTR family DNA-binding domain-containing protein [Cohnella suwonensis]|uniref:LytTR family DNA-binding domain-containing protein n=1 Tax=Cohnella suwonensis TaxID=696072 RepID=A0ABW0LTN7_9BACL